MEIKKIRLAQSIGELTKIYENWIDQNLPTAAKDELPNNGKLCAVELWHELQFLFDDKNRDEIEPIFEWLMEFINKWDAISEMGEFHPEFGDFPLADMPSPIPSGFADSSWHNDVMPSYWSESHQIRIWINYVNPELREIDLTGKRFAAYAESDNRDAVLIACSDSWQAILDAIDEYTLNDVLFGTCRNGIDWSDCKCC
jgi:hypothetical protein